jgi:hypothetical protein
MRVSRLDGVKWQLLFVFVRGSRMAMAPGGAGGADDLGARPGWPGWRAARFGSGVAPGVAEKVGVGLKDIYIIFYPLTRLPCGFASRGLAGLSEYFTGLT